MSILLWNIFSYSMKAMHIKGTAHGLIYIPGKYTYSLGNINITQKVVNGSHGISKILHSFTRALSRYTHSMIFIIPRAPPLGLWVCVYAIKPWKGCNIYYKDEYMCTFDLKSGYHHVDVCEESQKYLGFE